MLEKAATGEPGAVDEAVTVGAGYWDDWERQSAKNVEAAARGRRQANIATPIFRERVSRWLAGDLWDSNCRLRRQSVIEQLSRGNRFHPVIDMLQAWQQAFVRETLRVEGKEVGLATCGGGWFAVCVEGDEAALRQRVRRKEIVARTAKLQRSKNFREA